jgi:hypothetical protein
MGESDSQFPESFEMALVLARLCFVLGSIEAAGGSLSEDDLFAGGGQKDLNPDQWEDFLETLASQGLLLRRPNRIDITAIGRQWLQVTGAVLDASL